MRRTMRFLLAVLAAMLLAGCPKYTVGSAAYQLPIDAVESSPERPVELCGLDEVTAFLTWLRCAAGGPAYRSPEAALEGLDREYSSKLPDGRQVIRYSPSCYQKTYEIYIAPESCEKGRKPAIPFSAYPPPKKRAPTILPGPESEK